MPMGFNQLGAKAGGMAALKGLGGMAGMGATGGMGGMGGMGGIGGMGASVMNRMGGAPKLF